LLLNASTIGSLYGRIGLGWVGRLRESYPVQRSYSNRRFFARGLIREVPQR